MPCPCQCILIHNEEKNRRFSYEQTAYYFLIKGGELESSRPYSTCFSSSSTFFLDSSYVQPIPAYP